MSGLAWQQVVVATFLALSLLIFVGKTGKPREPITPTEAAFGVLEYGVLIALVLSL